MTNYEDVEYSLENLHWFPELFNANDIILLPWGSVEAHNSHLPYGTDSILVEYIAKESAKRVRKKGIKVIILPTIKYGVNCSQMDIPLTINLNPSTQYIILKDIVDSLEIQGYKKLIILNGHGGNSFSHILRELYPKTSIFICCTNWYESIESGVFFVDPGQHAGELETSCMLKIAPHLVKDLNTAGDGKIHSIKIPSLNERWAWAQRGWFQKTTYDTGCGNPHLAKKENGEQFLEATIGKVVKLITEVSNADLSNLYE